LSNVLLSMKNISKSYGSNRVLHDINLEVKPGEIHALIGENGAGKSTLMNILFGMPVIHQTGGFEGSVELDGSEVNIKSPFEAMELGIGMVHQEFMLVPGFSVTENIKLNREITKKNAISSVFGKKLETIDFEKMGEDAAKALKKLNMDIDEWSKVAGLPVGHMQFIEIAREIDKKGVKLLVFDEPTAVLTEVEAKNLLRSLKMLAGEGIGILFISHRLSEITDVADTVTVLRDGEFVDCKPVSETDAAEIAKLMVGRDVSIEANQTAHDHKSDETILDIKDLVVNMPGERVKGVDLEVKKGEILGIGGLAGQGKLGIANGIMGVYESSGSVVYDGKKLKLDAKDSMENKLAFVSEDRKGVGLLLDESIELNIAFPAMQIEGKFIKKFGPFNISDSKAMKEHAGKMIEDLDIRCTSSKQNAGNLSGGNQQKVCIAKALTQDPKLLFVSEPTRGIDIGAKKLVLDVLRELNEKQGMTIIMTSSELAELRSICDRIAIVCEGQVAGILPPDASDVDFGLMMSGDADKVSGGMK